MKVSQREGDLRRCDDVKQVGCAVVNQTSVSYLIESNIIPVMAHKTPKLWLRFHIQDAETNAHQFKQAAGDALPLLCADFPPPQLCSHAWHPPP